MQHAHGSIGHSPDRWGSAASFTLILAAAVAACQDVRSPTAPTDLSVTAAEVRAARSARGLLRSIQIDVASSGRVELPDLGLTFDFDAAIQASVGRHSGGAQFSMVDGSVRFLHVAAGRIEGFRSPDGPTVSVLMLPRLESGDVDPTRPAIAVARPHPSIEGRIIWEISGFRARDAANPESFAFELPGEFAIARRDKPSRPAAPWFRFHYKRQQVTDLVSGAVAGFRASGRVRRDNRAAGSIELAVPFGTRPLRYEPVYGAPASESDGRLAYHLILVLADAPLELENVLVASVQPDPALPGCDIWDLEGGETSGGAARLRFDARGRVRFHRPRGSLNRG